MYRTHVAAFSRAKVLFGTKKLHSAGSSFDWFLLINFAK